MRELMALSGGKSVQWAGVCVKWSSRCEAPIAACGEGDADGGGGVVSAERRVGGDAVCEKEKESDGQMNVLWVVEERVRLVGSEKRLYSDITTGVRSTSQSSGVRRVCL